jgi:hypothetical protein
MAALALKCPTNAYFSKLNGRMLVSTPTICRFPIALSLSALAAALVAVAASQPAPAQGTFLWNQSQLEVDPKPPVISNLKVTGEDVDCEGGHCPRPYRITFEAKDKFSPIARAEYSLDAGLWQSMRLVGKHSNSRRAHYEIRIWLDVFDGHVSEHVINVRACDMQDNAGVASMVIEAREKDK